jgi:hypothetical protein
MNTVDHEIVIESVLTAGLMHHTVEERHLKVEHLYLYLII